MFNFTDNIDTRSALDAIRDLVSNSNIYIRDHSKNLNSLLLRKIAIYITDILHIFGAINGPRGGIGFPIGGSESGDVRNLLIHFQFPLFSHIEILFYRWKKP